MAEEKPRLSRLTAILTELQSRQITTARILADKHDVSIRTIYRDIRTLEKSGIPIYTEEGKGYSLMDGFKLPPVMFTEDEAHALITAEQFIRQNKDQSLVQQYESAITKIKSILKSSQKSKTEFLSTRMHIRGNYKQERTSSLLIHAQSAIANFTVISIDYLSLKAEESSRDIEPFAIYSTQDNWIVIAFCRLKNDFRAFRLDCIQKFNNTGKTFSPHQLTLEEYFEMCRKKW